MSITLTLFSAPLRWAIAQAMTQQTPAARAAPARHGWWRVETPPGQSVDTIQAQFRAIFETAGSPQGAALFCDHVLLERPALLFTPQAAALARPFVEALGGAPCDDPPAGIFLVGNDGDRGLLPVPELTRPVAEQ